MVVVRRYKLHLTSLIFVYGVEESLDIGQLASRRKMISVTHGSRPSYTDALSVRYLRHCLVVVQRRRFHRGVVIHVLGSLRICFISEHILLVLFGM